MSDNFGKLALFFIYLYKWYIRDSHKAYAQNSDNDMHMSRRASKIIYYTYLVMICYTICYTIYYTLCYTILRLSKWHI